MVGIYAFCSPDIERCTTVLCTTNEPGCPSDGCDEVCIDPSLICNRVKDCVNGLDESLTLCGGKKRLSWFNRLKSIVLSMFMQ